jgi:eukaryotic-like serine/threonine-protein kinase
MRVALGRLAARLGSVMNRARTPVPVAPLAAGMTLGAYRLVAPIRAGTRTEVWQAKITGEQGFEKTIALKALRPEAALLVELVGAFTGEAATVGRLYHANIVQPVDSGLASGRYYIAMELVDGLTLAQIAARLRERGQRFPVRLLAAVALQMCAALEYAHELADEAGSSGLLHRDLTPDNVMLSSFGVVKVIDFGAASPAWHRGPAGPVGENAAYVPPERIDGSLEDRRSDLYSLGVILYELATGMRPYREGDITVVEQILEGRARHPREVVGDFPEELSRIILKAMARRPDDRYASARLLANALEYFVARRHGREHHQDLDPTLKEIFSPS